MDSLLFASAQSPPVISRLSLVEFESALATKIRTRQLDLGRQELARRSLRADIAQRRISLAPPLSDFLLDRGRQLVERFGIGNALRTLDALQLAVALDLFDRKYVSVLVTADANMRAVAAAAGCDVIDPANPALHI